MSLRLISGLLAASCLVGGSPVLFASSELGLPADEMLRTPEGRWERWTEAPELVVLTSVMEYHARGAHEYRATGQRLPADEIDTLVADLTQAVSELSGQTIAKFAAVHHQPIAAGERVAIMQRGRIVVGRYQGLRDVEATLGFGGRQTRDDGSISAAAMVLDAEFDRTSAARRLLRLHELGHALGFNHVTSRVSVMNAHIGNEPTDSDRYLARLAFTAALRRE